MFGGAGHVGGRVGQQFAEAGGSGRDAEYRVDADLMQLIDAGANMPGYCDDRLAVALGGFGHAGRRLPRLFSLLMRLCRRLPFHNRYRFRRWRKQI